MKQDGFGTKLFLLFPAVHFQCDAGVAFQPSKILGGTAKGAAVTMRGQKQPVALAKLPGSQLVLVSKVTGIA